MGTPLFLNGAKVPVYLEEDPDNKIWIKTWMSYGDEQHVLGASTRVTGSQKSGQAVEGSASIDMGLYNLNFLKANILDWEGPLFEGVPCTPENIERFNPKHPLFELVLKEINDRNKDQETGPSPNPLDGSGSTDLKESITTLPETTTSTSSSWSASE